MESFNDLTHIDLTLDTFNDLEDEDGNVNLDQLHNYDISSDLDSDDDEVQEEIDSWKRARQVSLMLIL